MRESSRRTEGRKGQMREMVSIQSRENHPHGDKEQPEESGQGPMNKLANVRLGPGRQVNKSTSGGSWEVTG